MANPVLLDFESQSRADLKSVGGRNYWLHPSTEPLCVAWHDTETGHSGFWLPGDAWPHSGRTLAAHNMTGFDRFACISQGWLDPNDHLWIDTSELARTAGLPGALDALGTRWLGLPKDKVASKFTRSLSSVRRPSKGAGKINAEAWRALTAMQKRERGALPEITDAVMGRVLPYCLGDVEIMVHGWPRLASWLDLEPRILAADRAINDRGVQFDEDLARALLDCEAIQAERTCKEVAVELGWTVKNVREAARSPQQYCKETGAADAQKATVAKVYHPLTRARQALASIAAGKLEAGLARVSLDGRLRDNMRYYGAHTGRWSGQGMQLHNLTRPPKYYRAWSEVDVEKWSADDLNRLADAVKSRKHIADIAGINILLRACLCARPGHTFAVCDFSGVEARALAWAAGDVKALEVFASGRDPYKVIASTIFGCPYDSVSKDQRQIGKIAELACGYGMGADKFYSNNASTLDGAGVDAGATVKAWRKVHEPIVSFWRTLETAFMQAVGGREAVAGPFTFVPSSDGRDVAMFLPSGRPIVYCDARVGGAGDLSYQGHHTREHIYGGKLAENAIQAACRDPMAEAAADANDVGLNPVLTVHDEIVCEVPSNAGSEAYDVLHQLMIDALERMPGFPAGAAGFVGERYRK